MAHKSKLKHSVHYIGVSEADICLFWFRSSPNFTVHFNWKIWREETASVA